MRAPAMADLAASHHRERGKRGWGGRGGVSVESSASRQVRRCAGGGGAGRRRAGSGGWANYAPRHRGSVWRSGDRGQRTSPLGRFAPGAQAACATVAIFRGRTTSGVRSCSLSRTTVRRSPSSGVSFPARVCSGLVPATALNSSRSSTCLPTWKTGRPVACRRPSPPSAS